MCAYNVRQNKRIDHDPPTQAERAQHQLREFGVILFGLTAIILVFWMAGRILL
jgi:hypothetical protein